MSLEKPCRHCDQDPGQISRQAYQEMKEWLAAQPPEILVTDDLFNRRYHACKTCDSLAAEAICRHCGCFVVMRASIRMKGCPYPGHPRWLACPAPSDEADEAKEADEEEVT